MEPRVDQSHPHHLDGGSARPLVMPPPAPTVPRFKRAVLPARIRAIMEPLAADIESLPASSALTRYLPRPTQGWSALESLLQATTTKETYVPLFLSAVPRS